MDEVVHAACSQVASCLPTWASCVCRVYFAFFSDVPSLPSVEAVGQAVRAVVVPYLFAAEPAVEFVVEAEHPPVVEPKVVWKHLVSSVVHHHQ